MLQCQVNFLDDTTFMWELERNALGRDLFNEACEHLDLLEMDYYGLAMWDSPNTRRWLDCSKEILKQIKGPVAEFYFNIKFYPPDPSILVEDITRYHLCLQLRKDIMTGRLPCPSDMLAVLGSYTVQSTLGDYDPNLHTNNYVSEIVLAPNQSEELDEKVMEQHATHRSMSPAQADMLFFEYAKTVPMYGLDLHHAKDLSGADVMLGVCSEGLMVYQDEIKTNSYLWPRVLKISHKRNTFLLKIRSSEDELDGDVSFTLPSYRACKQLWKCSVENHSFFRNRLQDTTAKMFLTLGSRFRYNGRTLSECLEASANITRAPPQFLRLATKRKANEEIFNVLKQPLQTESDDWFLVHDSEKWEVSTTDDVMLESKEVWESNQDADDWFVLLESSLSPPSVLQDSFESEEQSKVEIVEENESEERTTDELVIKRSYKVNVAQEGPVELKVMEDLARDIMKTEHPELKEQTMTMKESLTEEILQVNGERIQRVVITKQWTQEDNSFVESQEEEEKEIEVGKLLIMGSEKTSERLEIMEQRLQEVETIDQKLQDVELLRVGLQEIERLHGAERKGLQPSETADWYILLDPSPSLLTAAPTAEELINIIKPMERSNDWYILLEMPAQRIKLSASPTAPPSVLQQSLETEGQSKVEIVEENESEERTTDELVIKRSYKVNVAQEGPVELKVMEDLARDIMKTEHPELKEQTMTMKESLTEEILQVNGERIQRVVITKQWTQEDNSFVESQEEEEKEIEVGKLLIMGSEKTSERLEIMEQRLQEVETIDQKLLDVELLRVGLQEIERLHGAERKGLQPSETADWYILLDPSPSLLTAAPGAEKLINIIQPMERSNDWYILLEMPAQRIKLSASPTAPPSVLQQSLETEGQSKVQIVEENESEERTTDELVIKRSYKVNVPQEGPVELKVMEDLARDIMKTEHPELKEQTMTMKESLTEEILQVNGERIQRVVITKQWTQEDNSFVESQEEEEKEIEVGKLLIMGSEKTSERLEIMEQRLQEVETIDQKLLDVELLRVGLQEIERLYGAEREGLQQSETADWYILLDPSPSLPTAAPTAEELINIIKPMERSNDWYILLEMPAQRIKLSASPTVQTDVISTIAEIDQLEEVESREAEKKIHLLPPDEPKTQTCEETSFELYEETREEVTQSRVRRDKMQVTEDYRRPQQVLPEQQADRPQRDLDDDWFILLDVSPKTSVSLVYPYLRGATVEVYEESREEVLQSVERREEQESKQVMLEKKATQAQRDVEDDWFIILDVYLKGTGARFASLTPENRAVERRDEVQKKQHEKVTVDDRTPVPITPEQSAAQVQREREDDWSIILDDSPEASVLTTVEVHEESRETRVRKVDRVTEVMTVSTGQTVREEKMMMKVIQTPQVFPVVPREIDDDWFQMFDPVPYEQRSITSDVKRRDVVVHEPTKDQRAQVIVEKVVEEQLRGKTVLTEERRVVFEERMEIVDVVQQMFPVGVRQVDDDWCELLDTTPFEKRAVLSVDTDKKWMKEHEDRKVRDDVKTRMRQQEMRKQDLEVRRSQPAVIVQTVAQTLREVEDDWFVVFDVSPKQTVVADVIKGDKRGEEVKRREEGKKIEDKRRQAEQRRKEEERRRQIQVEDRQKRPVGPEKPPVWQQREREDDWFNLMGVSSKDSVSTRAPVISPVAVPKPRPQIPADQPLTSTPTIPPVSVKKTTYLDRTKDTLDITLESEAEDSVLMRKSRRWTKRIEGESIYVRHSILMLDDFDVTQEVVLRHHASVSELKRVFMEAMEDFGPTEWDRRLSSYSPMPKTQLPHANGDILISMGLIENGGKTVV